MNIELELAKADTKRMDWIEKYHALLSHAVGAWHEGPHVAIHCQYGGGTVHFYGATYREAIDAAMKQME